jgi:Bacterial transcriptional regulator
MVLERIKALEPLEPSQPLEPSHDSRAGVAHRDRRDDPSGACGRALGRWAWGGHGPTIIRWLDGAYPIPVRIRAGTTLPLLTSAVGHAFLAYLPVDMTEPILQREVESGLSQAVSAEEVDQLKSEVRSAGLSNTRGLFVLGSTALAAPVVSGAAKIWLTNWRARGDA